MLDRADSSRIGKRRRQPSEAAENVPRVEKAQKTGEQEVVAQQQYGLRKEVRKEEETVSCRQLSER